MEKISIMTKLYLNRSEYSPAICVAAKKYKNYPLLLAKSNITKQNNL